MSTLVVNEVYRAWQGEGPSAGRVCSIVRLMGCNLACEWATANGPSRCDEAQTWDASQFDLHAQGTRMRAADVAALAVSLGSGMVVITGGEPLLWQPKPGWAVLLDELWHAGVRVEVETNATFAPDGHRAVTAYNCSPKLSSAGMDASRRIVRPALEAMAAEPRAVFKFVAAGAADLAEVSALAWAYSIAPGRVWIMPAGTTRADILGLAAELAPAVLAAGWNLTLRQHHLIYDTQGEPR